MSRRASGPACACPAGAVHRYTARSSIFLAPARMTREPVDLLIEARWLLPIAPANTVLEHHAVAVADGRIVALGPAAELRARCEPREHVRREQHALLPGLVNAHARVCHALLRGLPVRGPRRRWLTEVLQPLEARAMGADFVRDGTRFGDRRNAAGRHHLLCRPEPVPRGGRARRGRGAACAPPSACRWQTCRRPGPRAPARTLSAPRRCGTCTAPTRASRSTSRPLARPALSDATLARVRRVADELEARIALHVGELSPPPVAAPRRRRCRREGAPLRGAAAAAARRAGTAAARLHRHRRRRPAPRGARAARAPRRGPDRLPAG